MNLRKKFLAASIAAIPLLLCSQVEAASPMMARPAPGPMMAAHTPQSEQDAAALVATLDAARGKYGLDQDHHYVLMTQHPGVAGTRISRLAHTYKGVRVFQSESVVVTNEAGEIISESASDRRNGLGTGPSAARQDAVFAGLDVSPTLAPQAAVELVVNAIAAKPVHAVLPRAELVIYPLLRQVRVPSAASKADAELNALDVVTEVYGYELAYLVQTRMIINDRPVHYDTLVSAHDGHTIAQWNALQTEIGTGKSQYSGEVPISTTAVGGIWSMKDALRGVNGTYGANAVTNANHGTSAGALYSNSSNVWGDGRDYVPDGSTTNANGQTAAVNAMWGLMNTYDMLRNVLGWQSLDGRNTATYIAAHVHTGYDNAYYSESCKCMYIGDGGTYFTSLGSVDVIGHEMGHGVTAATAGLTYFWESGGLNESASDINGEMVEAYARAGAGGNQIPNTGNDWMIGKEISRTSSPLRWMYKPSKDGYSADAWSSTVGDRDVHYSSGPNNRMFYFLSQGSNASSTSDFYSPFLTKAPLAMTGIGNDKAFRIWFRALTTKFTESTDYADARSKVLEAARELYGAGSREAIAVQRAYAAINVGDDVDEPDAVIPLAIAAAPRSITVEPGATASFAVRVTGGTTPYAYQWMRNGADIPDATSASYSLSAQGSDNGALFSVRVSDSSTPAATATSSAATLTVSSDAVGEQVVNGSFESGKAGWSGTTGVIGSWTSTHQLPRDGRQFAYLGGNGRVTTETLTQAVTIPASASSAQLSFALHIDTAETSTATPYDQLTVTLKDAAGNVLATLARYSNLDSASGYQVRSFELLPFKGQTVTLSFVMNEDLSLQTSFALDQVSLLTQ